MGVIGGVTTSVLVETVKYSSADNNMQIAHHGERRHAISTAVFKLRRTKCCITIHHSVVNFAFFLFDYCKRDDDRKLIIGS